MFLPNSCFGPQHNILLPYSEFDLCGQYGCGAPSAAYADCVAMDNLGSQHAYGGRGEVRPVSLPTSSSRKSRHSRKHRRAPRIGYARDGAFELDYPDYSSLAVGTGPIPQDPPLGSHFVGPQHAMGLDGPLHDPRSFIQYPNARLTQIPNFLGLHYPSTCGIRGPVLGHNPFGNQIPPAFARDENTSQATALQTDGRPQVGCELPRNQNTNHSGEGNLQDSSTFRNAPTIHRQSFGGRDTGDLSNNVQPGFSSTGVEVKGNSRQVYPINQRLPCPFMEQTGVFPEYQGQSHETMSLASAPFARPSELDFDIREMDRNRRPYHYVHPYAESEQLSCDGMMDDDDEMLRQIEQMKLTDDESGRHRKRPH